MNRNLGVQIDRMFRIDQAIDRAEAALRDLKQQRAVFETKMLRAMDEEGIDSCRGRKAVAGIRHTLIPTIKDRRKFQKYVIKNRAWDLFQNRVSPAAYFERKEDGISVPGVEIFDRVRLSIKKRS